MPDPNLQSYLAQHYLSGPKADAILARSEAGQKKRRKKRHHEDDAASSAGLIVRDDAEAWMATASHGSDEDGVTPQMVSSATSSSTLSGFKKVWTKEAPAGSSKSVAASIVEVPLEDEIAPIVKSGLRSKEEMRAARHAREARQRQEEEDQERQVASSSSLEKSTVDRVEADQETVYRDRSGRRINVAEDDAALKAAEMEQQRREKERETWGQGLAQRQARKQAAAEIENMRGAKIERRADDYDLNQHFRKQERSDDPALAFITKKRSNGPQLPKYKGPFPPNRFHIAPGYRWDGVDRSNGFEKMLFQRKNTLARQSVEARAWGQSDM